MIAAPADTSPPAPLLAVREVSKSYGGVRALRGVSLEVAAGEVHALVGENGAGKSTLIKVLSGAVRPDDGGVALAGRPLHLGSVAASERAGIAVIHQEPVVFPHLDAADNVFVGRELRTAGGLLLGRARMLARTRELLDELGEPIDPRRPVGELPMAGRQMVAIARALLGRCRLLVMDEPTASLSARETETLFRIVRKLRDDGVSVLYVSHRLEEIFELAGRVSVLRDGRHVATRAMAEVDRAALIGLMVGRELGASAAPPPGRPPGEPALELSGVSGDGFEDVSLTVRAGEIVALAGLVGAGRSELARAVFGIDRRTAGRVTVAGRPLPAGSIRAARAAGVALVPEDRQRQGLVLPMSVLANLTLTRLAELSRFGLIGRRAERRAAEAAMADLDVRAASPAVAAETLSGGNQQKLVVGKWLTPRPRVLILDEPTRGIDVAAKAQVHRLVRELADDGVAVLLISSELPEVLAMGDRVAVMRGGQLAGVLPRGQATQESVLSLALGEGPAAARRDRPAERRRPSRLAALASSRPLFLAVLLAAAVAAVAWINPAFRSAEGLVAMLIDAAPAAIVACGLTLVIVTGEIDISVGSMMTLLAAVVGLICSTQHAGLPVAAAAAAAIALGAALGLLNGLLVAVGRAPSIIVTLGMLTALRGAAVLVMGGESIVALPAGLRFLGVGRVAGVPAPLIVAGVVIAATTLLARRTALGRRIYAAGSSPSAARLAGLSLTRIRLFVFTLTGVLVAVAALVKAPRLGVIQTNTGKDLELFVVTCVVVGGASISGGVGRIGGTLLAVLLLSSVPTFLTYLKLDPSWDQAILGAFILFAVLADHLVRRRDRREGTP